MRVNYEVLKGSIMKYPNIENEGMTDKDQVLIDLQLCSTRTKINGCIVTRVRKEKRNKTCVQSK
jgi:hypothetical protein